MKALHLLAIATGTAAGLDTAQSIDLKSAAVSFGAALAVYAIRELAAIVRDRTARRRRNSTPTPAKPKQPKH